MATETPFSQKLLERLYAPVDLASLAFFRILFGALMLVSVVRFWANGWIEEFYLKPSLHFHYLGFSWLSPWPAWGMYAHFIVLGLSCLGVMLGLFYRVSAILLFLSFTYVELLEKATYLNHYYFISLLCLLFLFMPLHRKASLDALRKPAIAAETAPAWVLYLLRFQVGIVYFFAGVAKLGPDWLLRAEPLSIWLSAHTDVPLVGPFLAKHWVAHFASIFGAVFDLSVVFFLLQRRTRPFAYAFVVAFHLITGLLFPIGMFPWIMMGAALIFFPADWPRKRLSWLFGGASAKTSPAPSLINRPRALWAYALAVYAAIQILVPLRHFAYPGNTAWSEEGFRFAWRVMLVEKLGFVEYRIVDTTTRKTTIVEPSQYLTPLQARMMAMSPDMILELAHEIARDYAKRGRNVEVYADAYVTMNGRPSKRIIDPGVNLAAEQDSLAHKPWILPLN